MKTYWIILAVLLLILAAAVVGYFMVKRKRDKGAGADDQTPTADDVGSQANPTSSTAAMAAAPVSGAVLSRTRNNNNAEVKNLQQRINVVLTHARQNEAMLPASKKPVPADLVADGSFGSKTETALLYCTGLREIKLVDFNNAVLAHIRQSGSGTTAAQTSMVMSNQVAGLLNSQSSTIQAL